LKNKDIIIIDYKLGNMFNVQRAFNAIGYESIISDHKKDIVNSKMIVLPGVGAFKAGMKGLNSNNLVDCIKNEVKKGKPVLGICLGMQLMMSKSEEGGNHKGLDFFKGKVQKFTLPGDTDKFKVPHYGWSPIKNNISDDSYFPEKSILSGLKNGTTFYFVHSYYISLKNRKYSIATTEYGKNSFDSVLKKDNITACQFHPELSGINGLRILKNFIEHNN